MFLLDRELWLNSSFPSAQNVLLLSGLHVLWQKKKKIHCHSLFSPLFKRCIASLLLPRFFFVCSFLKFDYNVYWNRFGVVLFSLWVFCLLARFGALLCSFFMYFAWLTLSSALFLELQWHACWIFCYSPKVPETPLNFISVNFLSHVQIG